MAAPSRCLVGRTPGSWLVDVAESARPPRDQWTPGSGAGGQPPVPVEVVEEEVEPGASEQAAGLAAQYFDEHARKANT